MFYKRNSNAFWSGIVHALFFGAYSLSVNLTGDFLVTTLCFIPSFAFMWWAWKFGRNVKTINISLYTFIFFTFLFIGCFIFFWYVTPLINAGWAKIVNSHTAHYGENFKFYWAARILDTYINAISVVSCLMMILGFKQAWISWISKNIAAILLFSGIGFINVSVILINVFYSVISIWIFYKSLKLPKPLRIAFIGPGATGKTTILDLIKAELEKNNIKYKLYDEHSYLNPELELTFNDYMKDMKKNAYHFQKIIFKDRKKAQYDAQVLAINELNNDEKISQLIIFDRYTIDDFLYSDLHIKLANFNKWQTFKWKIIKVLTWIRLMGLEKLDYVFIINANYQLIQKFRQKRSEENESIRSGEVAIENEIFFQEVSKEYAKEQNTYKKALKKFSKNYLEIWNEENKQEQKAKDIIQILDNILKTKEKKTCKLTETKL
ncbi:nicotinamide mononucleotide transporter [Mycoplasmopsis columbina]|uniref:nicotinamide mononucleotide transporter n=1 Tax=Mycoplasmopsis columbina TaxID=114881 RepID=UPI0004A73086|nr:nicotinamide mononucleotide transporter [Mycoplasmopsis columbina]VEU76757.1 Uncharacterised protein [Mycoplasmopsis columbina]